MKRLVKATRTSEFVTMALAIISLPRSVEKVDGLAVFPGQREPERVIEAIACWQQPSRTRARHLLIAGQNERERTVEELNDERLSQSPYHLVRTEGLVVETEASNTKDQTDWVARQVSEKDITSLAIFTSLYHMLRTYLTLIQSLATFGIVIPLYPVPTNIDLATVCPETNAAMWEMIPAEIRRLLKYIRKGDVTDFEGLQIYLSWLHQHMV